MRTIHLVSDSAPRPLYPAGRIVILIVVVAAVVVLASCGYSVDAAAAAVALCGGTAAELAVQLGIPAPKRLR